jgi:hypothetical protein
VYLLPLIRFGITQSAYAPRGKFKDQISKLGICLPCVSSAASFHEPPYQSITPLYHATIMVNKADLGKFVGMGDMR